MQKTLPLRANNASYCPSCSWWKTTNVHAAAVDPTIQDIDTYTKTWYFVVGSAATNSAWECALRTITTRPSSRNTSNCLTLEFGILANLFECTSTQFNLGTYMPPCIFDSTSFIPGRWPKGWLYAGAEIERGMGAASHPEHDCVESRSPQDFCLTSRACINALHVRRYLQDAASSLLPKFARLHQRTAQATVPARCLPAQTFARVCMQKK